MKKVFSFLVITMTMNNSVFCQNYNEYYFGEDVYLYKNALLKIDPKPTGNLNYCFYKSLKDCQTAFNDNVLYPEKQYKFTTSKAKLEGRIFNVDKIIDKQGNDFTGKASRVNAPILIIKDTTTKEVIYFKYDVKYATTSYGFPFLTNVTLPEDYFCDKLESKKDDFSGEITIQNPYSLTTEEYIYKKINKSDTTYYLSLKAHGSTITVDGTGVIILFEDGSKLEKPDEKIDVKVGQKDYDYSCFIRLSKDDIQLLRKNKISKDRLYIYDTNLSSFSAESLVKFTTCIVNK
jgi:hypothetical protein